MHEGHTVQIFVVHGHSGDLVVIVGRVVIDTCIGVAAACVEGDLVLAVIQLTAAALLLLPSPRMWKNWLTLLISSSADFELPRVKATLTKRDIEERSPGRPMPPMPRLSSGRSTPGAKVFSGSGG